MSPQRKTSKQRAAAARAARASVLAAQHQAERRRRWLVRGGFALAVLVAGVGLVLLALRPASPAAAGATPTPAPTVNSYGARTGPPWPVPPDPAPGMAVAGLSVSDMSAMAQHFHAHLDVIVNGRPVPVPADLGIDSNSGQMAALHTHDGSGLIHVESSDPTGRYILGQLFNEWNVALDATHLGGLTVGPATSLRMFVDGVETPGNPAALPLREHQQITLVYGPANAPVAPPAQYDFSGV